MGNPDRFSSPRPPDSGFQTRIDRTERPCEAIIRALAVAEGVEPTALPPLYDVVDPEALNALLDPTPVSGSEPRVAIKFSLDSYRIHVVNSGVVTVLEDLTSA